LKKEVHSTLSEAEIIDLARSDKKYFGMLYERYFDQIFRFVYMRLGGQEDLAGDLTQQTFIKAMTHMNRYEDRGFSFGSWLYRIAQNEVSMHFRKSKKNQEVPVDEGRIKDLADEVDCSGQMSIEDQEKLIEFINELEQEQQDLIELRFFQQFSFKEIADIYNITEANAKMRTYRILERIAKKWKEKR
jgi:RNA polymerase sigma-70 factor, ECF subfamily